MAGDRLTVCEQELL